MISLKKYKAVNEMYGNFRGAAIYKDSSMYGKKWKGSRRKSSAIRRYEKPLGMLKQTKLSYSM